MVMIMLSIDIPRIRSCLGWISRKGFRGMRWRAYSTVMPRETVAFWIVMVMRNYQPFFFGERAKTFFMSTLARPYCQFSPVIGTNAFIFFCLESPWRDNIMRRNVKCHPTASFDFREVSFRRKAAQHLFAMAIRWSSSSPSQSTSQPTLPNSSHCNQTNWRYKINHVSRSGWPPQDHLDQMVIQLRTSRVVPV